MRRRLDAAFEHPPTAPLLYAAGHEHTLQVVDRSAVDQSGQRPMELVSGTGSRGSKLRDFEGLVYGTVRHGYMRVDFFEGRARLRVMALRDPDTSSFRMVYWCDLPYDGRTACPAVPR